MGSGVSGATGSKRAVSKVSGSKSKVVPMASAKLYSGIGSGIVAEIGSGFVTATGSGIYSGVEVVVGSGIVAEIGSEVGAKVGRLSIASGFATSISLISDIETGMSEVDSTVGSTIVSTAGISRFASISIGVSMAVSRCA
ncbi:MAG: hypothetical protein RLZZ47_255 [Bacteroidota bacterium]